MGERREKGMGNIYQRENGQWGGRLDIGRDYNVRRKMKYFSGRTKADIKRKIREYNRAAGVIESEKKRWRSIRICDISAKQSRNRRRYCRGHTIGEADEN